MVVWCSGPRRPPEVKKFIILGSFLPRSCNDRKKKSVQSRCFANLTLLLFCRSCCSYMYVWIHGHRDKKSFEFEADPASNNLALKSREHLTFEMNESL